MKSSNPQDEVFIVNFNDEYYLDQDFTNDLNKMREALEKVDTRGGTALYDAVVASADHLKKNAKLEKRVLFVVTDGEDNESQETLEQAIRRLQEENGPTVYAIGLLGEEKQRRARKALQFIAEKTGGIAFFPKSLEEVDAISRTVAHDIRNQYTLGYKPTNPKTTGGYRTIKVDAKAKGYGKLTVRTKSGYYAGQDRAEAIRLAIAEIRVPLVGSTITPIVVFLPLISISGVTGTFFKALAITVGMALLTSLALALLTTSPNSSAKLPCCNLRGWCLRARPTCLPNSST